MEIIEKEKADAILHMNGSRESLVCSLLKRLGMGEALIVKRTDWRAKMAPTQIARNLEKRSTLRFRTGRLPDNSGWIMQRTA